MRVGTAHPQLPKAHREANRLHHRSVQAATQEPFGLLRLDSMEWKSKAKVIDNVKQAMRNPTQNSKGGPKMVEYA
jgi:hypothetical protein